MATLISPGTTVNTNFPELGTTRDKCPLQFRITGIRCGSFKEVAREGLVAGKQDLTSGGKETEQALARRGGSYALLEVSYISPCILSGFQFDVLADAQLPVNCSRVIGIFGGVGTTTDPGAIVGDAYKKQFHLYATENQIVGHYNYESTGSPLYLPVATTPRVLCYILVGGPECTLFSKRSCPDSIFSIASAKAAVNTDIDGTSILTRHLETWGPPVVPPIPSAPTPAQAAFYRLAKLMATRQFKPEWDANGTDGVQEDRALDIVDMVAYANDRFNAYNKIRSKEIVPGFCCEENLDCDGDLKILCVECYPSSQRKEQTLMRKRLGFCPDLARQKKAGTIDGQAALREGVRFVNASSGFNSPGMYSEKPVVNSTSLEPQDMVVTVAYRSSMPVSGLQFDVGYNAFGDRFCANKGRVELHPALQNTWIGQTINIDDRFGYDKVSRVIAYQFPKEELVRDFSKYAGSTDALSKLFLANSMPATPIYHGIISFVIEGCVPIGCPCPEPFYLFAEEMPENAKNTRDIKYPDEAARGAEYVGPVVFHEGEWYTADAQGRWMPSSRLLEKKWTNMELINSRLVSNFIRKELEHPQQRLEYSGDDLTIKASIPATYTGYADYFNELINNRLAQKALFNGLDSNPNFSTYEAMSTSLAKTTEPDYKGYDLDANLDGKFDVADLIALINLATLRMIIPFKAGGAPADSDVGADDTTGQGDSSRELAGQYAVAHNTDQTNILLRLIRQAKIVPIYICLDELCTCTLPEICPDICDEDYDGALLNFSDRLDIPKTKGGKAVFKARTTNYANGHEITIKSGQNQQRTYQFQAGAVDYETSVGTVTALSTTNITGITQANPAVVTTNANHGLAVGDYIGISGVSGMTGINTDTTGLDYIVASTPLATTFTIKRVTDGVLVNSTGTLLGGAFSITPSATFYKAPRSGTLLSDSTTLVRRRENYALTNQEFRKAIMCGPANSVGYTGGHGILGSADNTTYDGHAKRAVAKFTFLSGTPGHYDNQTVILKNTNAERSAAGEADLLTSQGAITGMFKFTDDVGEGATHTAAAPNVHSDGVNFVIQLNGLIATATIAEQFKIAVEGAFPDSQAAADSSIPTIQPVRDGAVVYLTQMMGGVYGNTSVTSTTSTIKLGFTNFEGGLGDYKVSLTTVEPIEAVIKDVSNANPGVVETDIDHHLRTGQTFTLQQVSGMSAEINQTKYKVGTTTAKTFQVLQTNGSNLDTSGFGTHTGGGVILSDYHPDVITLTNTAPGESGNTTISYGPTTLEGLDLAPAEFSEGATHLSTLPDSFKDWSRYFNDISAIRPHQLYNYNPRRLLGNGMSFFKVQLCANSSDIHFIRDAIYTLDFCGAYADISSAFKTPNSSTGVASSGPAKFYALPGDGFEDVEIFDAETADKIVAQADGLYLIPSHGKVSFLVHNKADEDLYKRQKYNFAEHPSTAITHDGGQLVLSKIVVSPIPDYIENRNISFVSGKNAFIGEPYGSVTYRKRPRGTFNPTSGMYTEEDDIIFTTAKNENGWLATGPDSSYYSQFYEDNSASLHTYADYMLHVMVVGPRTIDVLYNSSKPFDGAGFAIGTWNGAEVDTFDPNYGIPSYPGWHIEKSLTTDVVDADGLPLDPTRYGDDGYSTISVYPTGKASPQKLKGSGILCRINFNKPVFEPVVLRLAPKNFICPPIGTSNNLWIPDLSDIHRGQADYPTNRNKEQDEERTERDKDVQKYAENDNATVVNDKLIEANQGVILHLDAATRHISHFENSLLQGETTSTASSFANFWFGNPGPVLTGYGSKYPSLLANSTGVPVLGGQRYATTQHFADEGVGASQIVGEGNTAVLFSRAGYYTESSEGYASDMTRGILQAVFRIDLTTHTSGRKAIIVQNYNPIEGFAPRLLMSLTVEYVNGSTEGRLVFTVSGADEDDAPVTSTVGYSFNNDDEREEPIVASCMWDLKAGVMEMWLNGNKEDSTTAVTIDPVVSLTNATPNGWVLGFDGTGAPGSTNTSNGNYTYTGTMAEILVATGTEVTDQYRETSEAYLANKWGLSANLLSTHPGYNTTAQMQDATQATRNWNVSNWQEVSSETRLALNLSRAYVDESVLRLDSDRCAAKWVSERVWIDKSNEFLLRLKPSGSFGN